MSHVTRYLIAYRVPVTCFVVSNSFFAKTKKKNVWEHMEPVSQKRKFLFLSVDMDKLRLRKQGIQEVSAAVTVRVVE